MRDSPTSTPLNWAGTPAGQAGLTFGGYAEGLPSVGSTAISSGEYVARHNPYVDWQGAPANAIPAADTCGRATPKKIIRRSTK